MNCLKELKKHKFQLSFLLTSLTSIKISEKKTLDWNFRYIRSIFSARRHFF